MEKFLKTENKLNWEGRIKNSLAIHWPQFVDCKKRLLTETKFLEIILKKFKKPKILDAAMGIGCEVIWLMKKGYNVIGNEIEDDLKYIAREFASEYKLTLPIVSVDWRNLSKYFGNEYFHIIMLIGNSFSLLHEFRSRAIAAKAINSICKNSGVAIIDERNFRYILNNQDLIKRGNFRYSRKVIYCGTYITGRPIQIQQDCVRFGYFFNNNLIGTLDMHPFKDGELVSLFFEAGFRSVEIYSDLRFGFNENADFYTYVFYK